MEHHCDNGETSVDMFDLTTSLGMFETLPVLVLVDEECSAWLNIDPPSFVSSVQKSEEEEEKFDSDCTLEEVKLWG